MGKKLLAVLILVLVALAILTWGSVGSAMILTGLLVSLGYTGYRYYLDNRDDTDWYDE